MTEVIALRSFEHGKTVRRNDRFSVSDQTAKELAQRGLVAILGGSVNPKASTGVKLSASQVEEALQEQTAKRSGAGKRKTKKRGE